jgi:cytochrome c oxidase subunit 2
MVPVVGGVLNPEGPVARAMADLWWLMFGIGAAVFVLVMALLAVGLFRRREPGDAPAGDDRVTRRFIVLGGVALPVIVVLVVLAATVATMRHVPNRAPAGALVIEVVGHQWWWEIHYPEQGVTTRNELHLPVGQPVAVQLTSADVIHSFWVPALGGKLDLLPDGVNTLVLQADSPGEHLSQCAEFCGLEHADMVLTVVAESPDQFGAWVEGQRGGSR